MTRFPIVAALLAGSVQPSMAQAGAQPPADPAAAPAAEAQIPPAASAATGTDGTILVTGARLSNRRALASKRLSNQIIDAVSQDEVAQLPDVNIVEAARRIAGVSVIPDRDSTRSHDNYQYATIRGLDSRYNLVTVDGTQVASADSSFRGAQLALLPSSLVSEIQAIKTVTAQYDPHALGGQINLVTKSAFDTGNFFTAQALSGWTSQDGKVVPESRANIRVSATGALLFGADHQWGFVLSGEYQRLLASATASLPGDTGGGGWTYYTAAGTQTGNIPVSTGVAVPIRVQDFAFRDKRERYSANAKLEFRPNDRFGASLFGGWYHELVDEDRYEALALPTTPPTTQYVPGTPPNTGQLTTGNYQLGVVTQPGKRRTWLLNGTMHYLVTDRLELRAGLSDSDARYNENRHMYKFNTAMNETTGSAGYVPAYGYSYVVNGDRPVIALNNPALGADPNSFQPRYWRNLVYDIVNTVRVGRAELAWNATPTSRGLGADIGFMHTLTNVTSTLGYREYLAASPAAALAIGNLQNYTQPTVLVPPSAPGVNFFLIDPAKAQAILDTRPDLFRQTDRTADANAAFYQLREAIAAPYAQGFFRSDAVEVQAGVRYDDTHVQVGNLNKTTVGATTTYPFALRRSGYAYWLPSALGTWSPTQRLKVRGGVTKTLGRPDYGQYGATTTTSFDGSRLAIAQGNPDLKPRSAWNYDVSAEWYAGAGGLVSAALFRKDIKNEIFTKSVVATGVYDGVTYPATISQPVNASAARVEGVEVQLVRDHLAFLPGPLRNLGVSTNATWLRGRFDFIMGDGSTRRIGALISQPSHIYNASLFYNDGRTNLRFAFNRIGSAPISVDSQYSWRDIYADQRDQIDLEASYYVRPWLQVMAQVQNLTNSAFEAHLGPNRELLQTRYPVGRTVWFGLVVKRAGPHRNT